MMANMDRHISAGRAGRTLATRWLLVAATLALGAWPTAVRAQAEPAATAAEPAAEEASDSATEKVVEEVAEKASDAAQPKEPRQPPELGEGRLIQVRLPLVGNADAHYKSAIQRALDQLTKSPNRGDRRPVLILELVPDKRNAGYGEGTDFERALSLARFLTSRELAPVKTVAYIPRTIKGHAVLVALACEEIVMNPDAELGEAGVDENDRHAIEPGVVSLYQQIAAARRTVPEAIALGMLDRQREVLKVETDQGTEFVLGDELDALRQNHTIVSEEALVPRGSLGTFTGREGREYGFVKLLASDRDALARGLALPADAVIEDQSLVGDWRPVMINIEGPLTRRQVRQVQTLIGSEINDHNVNWIGLRIDSSGGELEDCLRLADTLAELDTNEVRTVAYVPVEASGGTALIALACDQLVMQPAAHIGGKGSLEFDRPTLGAARVTIRESLAKNTDYSWSLLAALVDPEMRVFTYQNTKTGDVRYFSEEEAADQDQPGDWRKGPALDSGDEPLRLSSKRAQELGAAWHVVDNFDELKQLYGFEADPRVAEPNWALELVEALSSPALTILLISVGIIGIYIELHSPGIGVGGFVSALAFMLFFWSKILHGTAGWLEVLLFVGGICFLLMELLVLPGFGIFGLGGGLMVLASLVLASQTFILPQTESQLAELRNSLTVVAAATVCVVAAALALRRYLPQAPVFRTLLLNPPAAEELADLSFRESTAEFSHLVGQQGTAATNLMPSGKAEFNGQLIDVIADRPPIDRGSTIVVVQAHANRVLVRAVEA
jgi:membrane-bound ClpP family serine protease